ncbi:hypothetical protein [Burkholderia sp. LS-044]|uniref:hypothetical protein n=1 Tax=Burkholderia sp. LS-044 TaxID=1459967 RepID=UPI0014561881|nr:hypothetical protein [Burkholderia sp. LS-044]
MLPHEIGHRTTRWFGMGWNAIATGVAARRGSSGVLRRWLAPADCPMLPRDPGDFEAGEYPAFFRVQLLCIMTYNSQRFL